MVLLKNESNLRDKTESFDEKLETNQKQLHKKYAI
jgi:hypothetical protein